jgi:proteasome accessory factor C
MLGDAPAAVARPRPDQVAAVLRAAQEQQHRVRIVYSRAWEPGVGERVIEPYALRRTRRGWEVDAGPLDPAGAVRSFLVSNIREVAPLEEPFEIPAAAAAAIERSRRTTPVTLVLPRAAEWVLDRFAEGARIVDEDEDAMRVVVDLLPPLAHRVGLLLLVAGAGGFVMDGRELDTADQDLARQLLAHHLGTPDP